MSGFERSATGEEMEAIETLLERERARVDGALAALVAEALEGVSGPLRAPIEYALSTSGKRLRPILCIRAYRACRPDSGEPPPALYRLSCALEIVHTYSLVHDDLPCMDDDDLRRGRPTVHRVHGNALATLAGAALVSVAARVLVREARALGLSPSVAARLVTELCAAAGAEGMVGGQLLDLAAERRPIDAAALEAIHRAKTGALLVVSLRLGALAAGAAEQALAALSAYGAALGLAFQIADDILDVTGDSADLGKTAGRDQQLSKASYPSLFGLDGARRLARERAAEAARALGDIAAPELRALASFVVDRRR